MLETGPLRPSKIHFYVSQGGARVTATWARGVVRIRIVLKSLKRRT